MSSSSDDHVGGSKCEQRSDQDGKDGTIPNTAPALSEQPLQELGGQLCKAASNGNIDCARTVIERGADVNAQRGVSSKTPLAAACLAGHEQMVKFLLSCSGVDVNLDDRYACTPLFRAVMGNHLTIVKLLLSIDDVDPNKRSCYGGQTPLIFAVENNDTGMVEALLRRGVDVNSIASYGNTALSSALQSKRSARIIVLLVICGAHTLPGLQEYSAGSRERTLIDASLAARDRVLAWLQTRRAQIVEALEVLSPLMPSAVVQLTTEYDAPSRMDAMDALRLVDPAWWSNLIYWRTW
jgi:hypothetical protein